jgi:hypothetical protein
MEPWLFMEASTKPLIPTSMSVASILSLSSVPSIRTLLKMGTVFFLSTIFWTRDNPWRKLSLLTEKVSTFNPPVPGQQPACKTGSDGSGDIWFCSPDLLYDHSYFPGTPAPFFKY